MGSSARPKPLSSRGRWTQLWRISAPEIGGWRHLVLNFDVNKTIVMMDSVTGKSMVRAVAARCPARGSGRRWARSVSYLVGKTRCVAQFLRFERVTQTAR